MFHDQKGYEVNWGATTSRGSLPVVGRRAAGAVACAAALAVAGCGGSSNSSSSSAARRRHDETTSSAAQTTTSNTFAAGTGNSAAAYVQQLLPVIKPWQVAALTFQADFTRAVTAHDKARVTQVIETFRTANDTFATRLSKLSPPATAQGEQDDLVKKVKQLGSDLETAKSAFDQTNTAALQSADAKIKSDTQALIQSAAALGQAVRATG